MSTKSDSVKLQPVRGTQDLLGEDLRKHRSIIRAAESKAFFYGYEPIETPIFEQTSVFKRTLGETSDVVGKEMYTFQDRAGEDVTLRPEGTAGVVRAVISGGMTQDFPLKFIYAGPMMRYERPQLGRRRQFHQIGVEFLGPSHPLADVETIELAYEILKSLNLGDRVHLHLNTLGDPESRGRYRQALVDFLLPYTSDLSPDSQERLSKNPLRIFDSKNPTDQEIIQKAPCFSDYLSPFAQDYFERVCQGLQGLSVPFSLNRRLVRGLDYYTHTAFEFVTQDLGAQGTVCAGGRYDGLMEQMGGPQAGGIGWAMGIERLALMISAPPSAQCPAVLVALDGEDAQATAFSWLSRLRQHGIRTTMLFSGNLGKQMKKANKMGAKWVMLLGENERIKACVTVRDLETGHQTEMDFSAAVRFLAPHFPTQ